MKSIFDMTGVERAAALLVALGPKIASSILKELDEDSIDKLIIEIAKIDKLPPEEKEDLIGEFLIDLRKERRRIKGGENKARDILVEAFGEERADEVLNKFSNIDAAKEFEFLNDIEDEILISFLKDERPQTIAVTLGYLNPEKSAVILKSLGSDIAKKVAVKMAKMESVLPEAALVIARTIKKRYKKYLKENQRLEAGGVDSLVSILGHMSIEDERKIMNNLDISMPDVSRQIRDKIFAFENTINLTNSELRFLIDEINDDRLIALALKGAGDDIRFKFLRNMSQNRATDVLRDMDALGPIILSEVEDSRNRIVDIMRRLNDRGVISLGKGDDIYIK